MPARHDEHQPVRPVAWARLLLLIPFVAMLWVPFYNSVEPSCPASRSSTGTSFSGSSLGAVIVVIVYKLEH